MSENIISEDKESTKNDVKILRNRLSIENTFCLNPIQNSEVEGEIFI